MPVMAVMCDTKWDEIETRAKKQVQIKTERLNIAKSTSANLDLAEEELAQANKWLQRTDRLLPVYEELLHKDNSSRYPSKHVLLLV